MRCGKTCRPRNSGGLTIGLVLAAATIATVASATDYLGGAGKLVWSPDSRWFAFNVPGRKDLHIAAANDRRFYILRPVGNMELDTCLVVSDAAPTGEKKELKQTKERVANIIPVPGETKLQLVAWSPDSLKLAYRGNADTTVIFAPGPAELVDKLDRQAALPWETEKLQVLFEFSSQKEGAWRYQLRVKDRDGKVLHAVEYDDRQEVSELANMRYRDCSFLSADMRFLLYPRHREGGWQLMRQSLGEGAPNQPVAVNAELTATPYEWKLSPDLKQLAYNDDLLLRIGPLDDWSSARSFPIPPTGISMNWSPDGSAVAFQNQKRLMIWIQDGSVPFIASEIAAPRFWGWRNNYLLFGNGETSVAHIQRIDLERPMLVESVTKRPQWTAAPYAIGVSPDGKWVACLVNVLDGISGSFWQVWLSELNEGSQWEMLTSFREEESHMR